LLRPARGIALNAEPCPTHHVPRRSRKNPRNHRTYFRTGRVSFGGIVKEVSLACVPDAKIGDYVLVHVGMALSVVDEREADEVFTYLKEMGELEELSTPPPAP